MRRDLQPIIFFLIFILVATAVFSLAVRDAFARTEARYLLRAGDAYFGNDLYASRSIQNLFHQQTLFQSDTEHYDLSMPAFDNLDLSLPASSNSLDLGPTAVGADDVSATSNILPFGLVNLAFPSIHEDSTQVTASSRTGFLSANYNYRLETDYGNIPVSAAYPATVRQVMEPASMFGWSQLYPEQFGAIAIQNKIKSAGTAAGTANASTNRGSGQTKPADQTSSGTTAADQTDGTVGTWLNQQTHNSTDTIFAPGDKFSSSMDYFKAKNASSRPQDMPVIYPWLFDMADKTMQTFPSNGAGGTYTNGGGSTGATFTRGTPGTTTGTTGNKTSNGTGNTTAAGISRSLGFTTTQSAPSDLTYAGFNFDATTQQINDMPLLERMWRNSHRGGTMGKAYAGPTDAPYWIDPYERPYDVSMIDEHWYILQCALNMTQPGTQILPRLWSLMW